MDGGEVKQYIGCSVIEEARAKQVGAHKVERRRGRTQNLALFDYSPSKKLHADCCKSTLKRLEEYLPTKVVGRGSIVTLSVDGEEGVYVLVEVGGGTVGPYQVVSLKSPVGKAIAGRPCGETLTVKTPDGSSTVRILDIA